MRLRRRPSDNEIDIWIIERWRGTVTNRATDEHDRLAWFALQDIRRLRLATTAYVPLLAQVLGDGRRSSSMS